MDVEIFFKKIYENLLDLIKRYPDSLALNWFESKNIELLSQFKINLNDKIENNRLKKENFLADLRWDCDSNIFMTKIGNFLNNLVNQREKSNRSNLGQEFTPFYIVHQIIQQIEIINSTVTRNKSNITKFFKNLTIFNIM